VAGRVSPRARARRESALGAGARRAAWIAGLAWCALVLPRAALAEKWDAVPPEDLAAKPPRDTTAGAEALFWKVWVEDERQNSDILSIRRHYVRVKIHTAEAAQKWTSHEILFPARGARVQDVQARTIQPDGRITEMEKRSIARETVVRHRRESLRSVRFSPPNVQPGSIVEYRYVLFYEDRLAHYEEFLFQMEVPVRRVVYHLKPLDVPGLVQRQMTFHARPELGKRSPDGYSLVELANVPAFRSERHMPPDLQVQPWMLLFYTEEKLMTPARYWREKGTAWAKDFDQCIKADDAIRRTASEVLAGASGDDDRLRRLAAWCRRVIRRVPSNHRDTLRAHAATENTHARQTLKQRAGTPWDIDMLFAALARAAGFEVRLLRVPSRRKLYFDQEMMDPRFVSSYQVAVRRADGWRSYDPQERWLPWDMVPWDEEAQSALLCDGDSTFFLETQMSQPARSRRVRHGELVLEENGDLSGDIRVRLTGHWNAMVREALEDAVDPLAAFLETMDWEDAALDVSGLQVLPVDDAHEEFLATVRLRVPGHAATAGRRLLLEPSAWWAHVPAAFHASSRRWPIAFRFSWMDEDSIRIRLPDPWRAEAMPAVRPVSAQGVCQFQMRLEELEDGRVLACSRRFEMGFEGSLYFPVSSYSEVKKLYDLLHDRDRTSISLVRREAAP
jgi:hypothetical protein